MNIITKQTEIQASPFDSIRGYRADGTEYWTARELMRWLGYKSWQYAQKALSRAMKALENQGHDVTVHVMQVHKLSNQHNNKVSEIVDFELSRLGCYTVAMNADPEKEMVALAQGYFAKKTREAEVGVSTPKLPSRALAVETAIAIDRIQDILSKSNPRLAQILIDHAMNDVIESQPKLTALEFPEDRWYGLVQIADKMGIKTDASSRVKLGQYVGKLGLERVREERLCNGQFQEIWCYRDNEETRQAILDWHHGF